MDKLRGRATTDSYISTGSDSGSAADGLHLNEDGDDDNVFEEVPEVIPEKEEEEEELSGTAEEVGTVRRSTTGGTSEGAPEEEEAAAAADEGIIKHSFKRFTTELDQFRRAKSETPSEPSGPSREELIEKFHALAKEKKELRKRHAQAQTNICQYLRKHNIDLFPRLEADKSQVRLLGRSKNQFPMRCKKKIQSSINNSKGHISEA